MLLSPSQTSAFHEQGFVLLPSFYEEKDLLGIQQGIYGLIDILARKHAIPLNRAAFSSETFDSGFNDLIKANRKAGSELYDAIKQIPAFVRLASSEQNERLVAELRSTSLVGFAGVSYGIRIDNPGEERFRSPWHQEYLAHFRSLNGIVFWSPLVPISTEMGPVELCPKSHRNGIVKVQAGDPEHPEKTGSYGTLFQDEQRVISQYSSLAPLLKPGDLLLMDFLTIHRSGVNRGNRSRWSMQFRFFDFTEPTGIRISWCGSYAAGIRIKDIHPEAIAE